MRSRAVLASLAMGSVLFVGCSDKSDGGGGAAGAHAAGATSAGSSGSGVAGAAAGSNAGGAGGAAAGAGGSSAGSSAAGAAGSSAGSGGAGVCAGALICDDFESYTDKPAGPWTVKATQGAVKIDTERHVSGTKSVTRFICSGVSAMGSTSVAGPFRDQR